VSERRFRYNPGNITLHDYALKTYQGIWRQCHLWVCASILPASSGCDRQEVPVLSDPQSIRAKGSRENRMAISLMQFFGHQAKGPNITNTTKPALADHVALFSNSLLSY